VPLTLPLLVARVGANHKQLSLATNELAVFTNALDACANFHGPPLWVDTHPDKIKTEETAIVVFGVKLTRGISF
jgi:hypothetical protein